MFIFSTVLALVSATALLSNVVTGSSKNAKSKTAVKSSSSPSNSVKVKSPNIFLSKPKKSYKSNSKFKRRQKSIVKVTICGPYNGMFALATVEYENGKGGYFTDFHKVAAGENKPAEMGDEVFNIRYCAAPMM